ncbi:MAG: zinc ribbon domain-containing protein [Clostridia bacterium]|nr:zinc ribbon domain-containing protein [Clostridia bacterium]
MVCKNCGMANSDTAQVCSECGSVLRAQKPAEKPELQNPQGAAVQPPVQSYVVPQAPFAAPPVYSWYAPPAAPLPGVAPVYDMRFAPPVPPYPAAPVSAAVVQEPAAPPAAAAPAQEPAPTAVLQESAQQPSAAPAAPEVPPAPAAYRPMPMMPAVPYMQQGMYPYGYVPPMKDTQKTKAVWALVLGIVSLALPLLSCAFLSPLSMIAGIIAIILGGITMNKVSSEHRPKAIAGMVLGIVGTIVSLLAIIFLISSLSTLTQMPEWQSFYDQYTSFVAMIIISGIRVVMHTIKSVISQLEMFLQFMPLR